MEAKVRVSLMQDLIKRIQDVLEPSLLKKGYEGSHRLSGHCYAASEALYHALGGADSDWFPVRARDAENVTHWWLENAAGERLDPTHEQYTEQEKTPPYADGKRGGFLTKAPSKRAQIILEAIGES